MALSATQGPWEKRSFLCQKRQETLRARPAAGRAVNSGVVVTFLGEAGGERAGWTDETMIHRRLMSGGSLLRELSLPHLHASLRALWKLGARVHRSFYHFMVCSFCPAGSLLSIPVASVLVQPLSPLTWTTSRASYTKQNISTFALSDLHSILQSYLLELRLWSYTRYCHPLMAPVVLEIVKKILSVASKASPGSSHSSHRTPWSPGTLAFLLFLLTPEPSSALLTPCPPFPNLRPLARPSFFVS